MTREGGTKEKYSKQCVHEDEKTNGSRRKSGNAYFMPTLCPIDTSVYIRTDTRNPIIPFLILNWITLHL